MTTYSELIQRLFSVNLFGGVKLGLENCHRIDTYLKHPHHHFRSIHIAGTNGKGSVSTKMAYALQEAGYRVGLYTSPHISTFRERIRINGEMISEADVVKILPGLFALVEKEKIPATFFELTTFLAFLYFSQQHVDIAVLETGLGGRLDATNIITPLISVITSVSLEHTDILGTTIEEIAKEKAGIIKNDIPVVIGPRVPRNTIHEIVNTTKSPLKEVEGTFLNFDDENRSVAKTALEVISGQPTIPLSAIENGLKTLPPCRLQIVHHGNHQPAIVLDVAHNPDGLQHLFQSLHHMFPKRKFRVILGLSKTKDVQACIEILKKQAVAYHPVTASNGRGLSVEELTSVMNQAGITSSQIFPNGDIAMAVREAQEQAAKTGEVIVACGTFFIMGAIRKALGFNDPADPVDTNEVFQKVKRS